VLLRKKVEKKVVLPLIFASKEINILGMFYKLKTEAFFGDRVKA
jgi:hypothetical protein